MMSALIAVLPVAIWALCAISDLSRFKIPNRYVLILLLGWPVAALISPMGLEEAGGAIALFVGTLAAGIGLYALRLFGAGDAKLIAVSALWVGLPGAVPFILYTALAGALLAVLLVGLRRVPLPVFARHWEWAQSLHAELRLMPYGVAIAIGGLFALPFSPLMTG